MTVVQFLDNLAKLQTDKLAEIKGLGPILVNNLVQFTNSSRYKVLIEKFRELETQSKSLEIINSNQKLEGPLLGQVICITGTFAKSRQELRAELTALGALTTDSVTKKTTILLVGDDPGSKVEKAQNLGIEIFESIDELIQKFR